MKRRILAYALAACALASAGAQTVSVAAVELDAKRGAVSPYTDRIVGGCLDALFAAGYIATNADSIEGDRAVFDAPAFAVVAARDGAADYLFALELTYRPSKLDGRVELPYAARWRVVSLRDARIVSEGKLDGPPDVSETINASPRVMTDYGRRIVEAALPSMGGSGSGESGSGS